jgi:Lamin Tail Domain
MRSLNLCSVALLGCLTVACSESTTDGGGGAGSEGGSNEGANGSEGGAGAGTSSDGGSSNDGGTTSDGGSTSSQMVNGEVAINEISATEDWVELYNRGDAAIDIGGMLLADSDGAGAPKLDEAISFPVGTTVAPGASLFILAKQDGVVKPGEQEPQTVCAPGTSPCFYAPFGLSDGDGDEIFLLDGDRLQSNGIYPPAAAAEGESWCRLPDGTGDFDVCTPTPGAPNEAL